ncbi:TonB-dependent receptor plug domain-containing protein [Chitinimonas koreensis]|uniref:TonB-dependent receptor plug domain-containing protein n=1 Tax=Chitinimonas koreensis TaxID=356302 RepID=UPI001653FD5E|nr:TonB-dependent receptor [Chitinimonas koreensis]QNM95313.1 TonB-dependent receptor [Chitinimonas koreensis]
MLDTLYKATNHALTLAARAGDGIWTLKLGGQDIPYQGFANQYMDMTRNRSAFGNLGYAGGFGWGRLDARAYWQKVKHEMGFFSDERMGMMPMSTEGRNEGYRVQAELPAAEGVLRLGHELHRTRLDDWWPAAPGSMMMEPDPYLNINGGRRDRLAFFGEWEGKLADRWSGTFGLRHESVRMDTGTVQSYGCGMMCAEDDAAAAAFNAADRGRRDRNLDLTLVARHQVDDTFGYEFGAAQKTRSPNLYERYSWGRGTMAMAMIGWFGDGNGYVGNPDLAPEVARTLSATADWRAADPRGWQFSATPFYTKVRDYIDADRLGTFSPVAGSTKALLRFANHDATLYGLNLAWQAQAWSSGAWGTGTLKGKIDWTRGKRDDGGDLYHVMPLNALVALAHSQGAWSGELQLELVARKSRVDERRAEDVTAGYGLVNLQGRYAIAKPVELMLGVRNLFDRRYDLPLGGVNLAEAGASGRGLGPLAGQGRSVDVGVVVKF